MIPLSITLRNFMSYHETTSVDFRAISIACLSGNNGAGKSALLDAITWVLWGKSRAASDRYIITLGESEMDVTFEFALGNSDYRVFRRRSGNSRRLTLEFDTRPAGSDHWTAITGDNARATQQLIIDTLRMEYDTFTNSAFLMQGKADTFTEKTPGERKQVLGEILNLSDYDALNSLVRDRERDNRQRIANLREQIKRIDELLAHRDTARERAKQLEQELEQTSHKLEAVQQERSQLAAHLQALESLSEARKTTSQRLERYTKDARTIAQRVKKDQAECAGLTALLERSDEIETGVKQLEHARQKLENWNSALQVRRPLDSRESELQHALEIAKNQIQRKVERLTDRCATAEKQLKEIERHEAEIGQLNQESENVQKSLAGLEATKTERTELERQNAGLEADNRRLRSDMKLIETRMTALTDGDATCPVCRRPLGDGDHQHIQTEWESEGKILGDTYRSNRATIATNSTRLKAVSGTLKELETLKQQDAERSALIRRLSQEIKDRKQLDQDLQAARKEHIELLAALEHNNFAQAERKELTTLKAKIQTIEYDEAKHREAQKSVAKLLPLEQEFRKIEQARIRLNVLGEQIKENEERIHTLEADMNAERKELKKFDAQLAGADEQRKRHAELQAEFSAITAHIRKMEVERGTIAERLNELDRRAQEKEQFNAEAKSLALDADAYSELNTAFGRNGIQAMIIETILPAIQDQANELLSRMSTGHLYVEFRSTRQAVSNQQTIETLDIVIRDEFGERPYAMFSGGEAFRVNFAIRVALSKLLARRAGATIDVLVIDEGFGTQDASGRDGLIEALHSIESEFETILVITHIDEIRDMFPNRIEIVKTESGSHATVV